jgi:hypothetical protein
LELFRVLYIPDVICMCTVLLVLTGFLTVVMRKQFPHSEPVYTAYCIVNLMLNDPYCIWMGFTGYFMEPSELLGDSVTLTAGPRQTTLLFPKLLLQICRFQMARQTVSLVCEFMYQKRDWIMILHHLGVVGATAACPYVYWCGMSSAKAVFFFGGICEVSTVFLTLKVLTKMLYPPTLPSASTHRAAANAVHSISRVLFLVAFMVFRVGWWSVHAHEVFVVRMATLPYWDITILFVAACMAVLTTLQYYWAWLICNIAINELRKHHRHPDKATVLPEAQQKTHANTLIKSGVNMSTRASSERVSAHSDAVSSVVESSETALTKFKEE